MTDPNCGEPVQLSLPARVGRKDGTLVEIDRCATDAVSLVTGCRLGKRSMKFLDYGKVAATFVDLETGHAIRVVARDDSRLKAKEMFRGTNSGQMANPYKQQLEAYKIMSEEELFTVQEVRVKLKPEDLPGGPHSRVSCEQCGEGVNDHRERIVEGHVLCRGCAGERYYEAVANESR